MCVDPAAVPAGPTLQVIVVLAPDWNTLVIAKLLPLFLSVGEGLAKLPPPLELQLNVIAFSLTNFLERFENPGLKIRGFLFILENLKIYFSQFF